MAKQPIKTTDRRRVKGAPEIKPFSYKRTGMSASAPRAKSTAAGSFSGSQERWTEPSRLFNDRRGSR